MLKVYEKLKEYGLDMTVHITADQEHVRFSWKKDDTSLPGAHYFNFWEFKNYRPEVIEFRLCNAIDNYMELVKKLELSEH